MNQRGNITLYLLFSLAVSAGVGYGVYVLLHERSLAVADADDAPVRGVAEPDHRPTRPSPPAPVEPPEIPAEENRADRDAIAPPESDTPEADTVLLGVPGVDGALEPAQVERTIKRYMVRFERCLRRQQERERLTARGNLRIELVIDGDGSVARVTAKSEVPDALASCVVEMIAKLRFDKPTDGGTVTVVYPLAFVPARDGSDPLAR